MPLDQSRQLKTTVLATGIEPAPSIWQKWICCQLQHANIAVEVFIDHCGKLWEAILSVDLQPLLTWNSKGTRPLSQVPLPAKLMV